MAVSLINSDVVTDLVASPPVKVDADKLGGRVRYAHGWLTTNAADDIASIYRMVQLPKRAKIVRMTLTSAAQGTSCAANIGIYDTTENGAAAVDADLYASAVAIAAVVTNSSVFNESGTITAENLQKSIADQAGVATASQKELYDICITLTAATVAGGQLGLTVEYTLDG